MIWFHTIVGVVSLGSGLLVILRAKGSRFHRTAGWVYVASMYGLCGLSFAIRAERPLFGPFGAFHVMALVSAATVTAGLVPAVRRASPGWYEQHLVFMLWSYVGLVMATNSHYMDALAAALREPLGSRPLAMWFAIAVGWVLPMVVGAVLIPRSVPRYRRTFGATPANNMTRPLTGSTT